MSKFLLLLKINIQAILNPSKIANSEYAKDNKKKALAIFLVLFITVALLGTSILYLLIMADSLYSAGLIDMLPLIGMIGATALILFTGMYQTQSYLFSAKDLDLMLSMPVPKWTIMLSKLSTLYIENLIFSAFIILPAGAIYFYYSKCSPLFWIYYIIGWVSMPLFPLIIATIIGYLLGVFSAKFKFKNFISIVLSLAFMGIVLILSFNMDKFLLNIASSVRSIQEIYFKLYFPAEYFYKAFVNYSIIDLILFILLSIVPFVIFISVLSQFYIKIVSQLGSSRKSANYKHKNLKRSSQVVAVYKKELGRYFSSTIYVLNTSVGMIMMVILAIATVFTGSGTIATLMEMPELVDYVPQALTAIMFFMITMTATSASSISLEGANLWILKSAPIKISDIFMAKILVNLTVIIPLLYISIVIFAIGLDYTLPMIIITVIVTTMSAIYTSVFGLAVNLKFPKMDAVSDVVVVKQSISVLIATFGSMIFTGALAAPYIIKLNEIIPFEIYALLVSVVLLIASACCIMFINTKGKKIFENL